MDPIIPKLTVKSIKHWLRQHSLLTQEHHDNRQSINIELAGYDHGHWINLVAQRHPLDLLGALKYHLVDFETDVDQIPPYTEAEEHAIFQKLSHAYRKLIQAISQDHELKTAELDRQVNVWMRNHRPWLNINLTDNQPIKSKQYFAISEVMAIPMPHSYRRWQTIRTATGEILDNARGLGYKSADAALNTWQAMQPKQPE